MALNIKLDNNGVVNLRRRQRDRLSDVVKTHRLPSSTCRSGAVRQPGRVVGSLNTLINDGEQPTDGHPQQRQVKAPGIIPA